MSARVSSPIHLTILRRGDTNIIDLDEVDALIPRSETQVDSTFLQELAAEVMHLATPGRSRKADVATFDPRVDKPGTAVKDLERIGNLIFSHLLTEPARKRLRATDSCDLYLRLDEQLVHVPWELCHDGEQFLATKFRVGRQVITGYPIPVSSIRRGVKESLRVLLIADPTESLPEAGAEAEQLSLLLDNIPGVEVTLIGGKGARKVPLLAALQDHDVVHFAGHSHYDPENPGKSGWRLHEGILTASELSKLTRPPLLVFSNSCQAGATSDWAGGYRYEGQAFGIGSAFLLAGVRNYVGTFWIVHDEESVLFAAAFYQGIVAGLSLGDALLQARHTVITQRGWHGLTWASYMLYGDPAFTLLSRASSEPLPLAHLVPETIEQPQSTMVASARLLPDPQLRPLPRTKRFGRRSLLISLVVVALVALLLSHVVSFRGPSPIQQAYSNALTLLQSGQQDLAFAALQRLVAMPNNTNGLGYDGLASVYFEQGFLPQAKASLQKAPATSLFSLIAGDIAFSMGDKEKAAEEYLQATRSEDGIEWNKASAYNALGVLAATDGNSTKAKEFFHQALQEDAKNVEAYSNLGYLAWIAGQQEEAQRTYAKVLELRPKDELSELLSRIAAATDSSTGSNKTAQKILIVPFTVSGGNVRRLGEGEAFAWQVLSQFPQDMHAELFRSDNFLQGELSLDAAALINLANKQEATAVVWGELQSFSHKLLIYGKVWEKKTDTVQRVNSVQEGGNEKLVTVAQAFAEKITSTIQSREGVQ